jgi:hypothetical protein
VRALLGDGHGGFSSSVSTLIDEIVPRTLLADLNGDQFADLVYAPYSYAPPTRVMVRLGDGTGLFGPPTFAAVSAYPFVLEAADVDQDGDLDLLACGVLQSVDILKNNGSGVFSLTSFGVGSVCSSAALADIDADGKMDLLAGGNGKLVVRRGLGSGAFAPGVEFPLGGLKARVYEIQVGDLTGDGRLDVVCWTDKGFLSLLVGDAAQLLTPAGSFPAGRVVYGMQSMTLLDADGDQRLDLITGSPELNLRLSHVPRIEPRVYCSAKVNSLGCPPSLGWNGSSSATAPSGFTLSSARVRNRKAGLLLHTTSGRNSLRFSGGVLCVRNPIGRSIALFSGGSISGNDCSGVFAIDMNAYAAGGLGGQAMATLSIPGSAVTAQFWGRDPGFAAPNDTSLSAAIEYVVGP